MNEIREILDSIKTARTLKQLHIEAITEIYLKDEDINPDELFTEIERFAKRIGEPFSIIKKQFLKKIEKESAQHPELLATKSELFTIEDMKKPWEITESFGYMVFQDKASQKNSFFIKSYDRVGDKKDVIVKTDEKSLIPLLNSFAYENKTKWNKPMKQNGLVVGLSEELVDFRDADLTRFQHVEIVFDPRTEADIVSFEGRECLNSYSTPKMLSLKKKNNINNAWPLEIADFYRLLWNLSDESHNDQLYLLNWLAKNYQTKEVAQNFIILCGESGTGKGQLMKILTNIYGTEMIGSGSPENNIFVSKENTQLKNSLYYHADEVKITPEIWESSKNFIANNKFTLKANFENVRTYPNYAAFIFNMNMRKGQIPFTIPTEIDRRTSAIEAYNPLHCTKWFTQAVNDKFEIDKTFAKNVAQSLADYDYDTELLKWPLANDLRKKMLESGKPNMERYADALFNKDIEWFKNMGIESFVWFNRDGQKAKSYTWEEHINESFKEGRIHTKTVNDLYKIIFDDKEFKKEILLNVGFEEKVIKIEGHAVRCYVYPGEEEKTTQLTQEEVIENVKSTAKPKKQCINGLKRLKKTVSLIGGDK